MPTVPPRRTTDPRAIRTRAAVVAAAADLFAERGVADTTVATIAARARVGISSIYQ